MDGTLPMFRALFAASLICASSAFAETSVNVAAISAVPVNPADIQTTSTPQVPAAVISDVAVWQRLRGGNGTFDQALNFIDQNSDWPGLKLLRRKMEPTLPIGRRADDVLRFFGDEAPQTGRGARAMIAAYRALGDLDRTHVSTA